VEPIGNGIVLHKFTGDCDAPKTIEELTDRTIVLAEKAVEGKHGVSFGGKTELPPDVRTVLSRGDLAREALAQDIHSGVEVAGGREIVLHYGGEPVLRPGMGREVRVTVGGEAADDAEVAVPSGWKCESLGGGRFLLMSDGPVADRNTVTVKAGGGSAEFGMLGPEEAKGFPAGDNVQKCPKCWARIEACMCES
jgi:hypothetical protein